MRRAAGLKAAPTLTAWGLTSGGGDTWREQAACRNPALDPNLWTSPVKEERGQARWVCENLCQVLAACRRWARDNTQLCDQAVYGGVYYTRRVDRATGTRLYPVRPAANQPVAQPPTGRPAHKDQGKPRRKSAVELKPYTEQIVALCEAGVSYDDIARLYGSCNGSIRDFLYRWRNRVVDEDTA